MLSRRRGGSKPPRGVRESMAPGAKHPNAVGRDRAPLSPEYRGEGGKPGPPAFRRPTKSAFNQQPAGESNPSTRFERPAASPDAEQAVFQCVGQESNLHSNRGRVTAAWARRCPADASPTVARAGVEPAIGHQGLSPAALPVCVPRQKRSVRGSHPPTPARQTGRDPSRATERNRPVPGVGIEPTRAWFRARCHYQQRRPRSPSPGRRAARPGAVVGMAGFEPAFSCTPSRRIRPTFPTSR